jgi:hypothetical protein
MHSARIRNPLCRPGNLSLSEQTDADNWVQVDDAYCHEHSEYLRRAAAATEKGDRDKDFVREFIDFARREDPGVLPAMEAILATALRALPLAPLGLRIPSLFRLRSRLRQLGRCFASREPVPMPAEALQETKEDPNPFDRCCGINTPRITPERRIVADPVLQVSTHSPPTTSASL